ncbi:phenylalanyl-tRNA synthetase beta chain [Burkholderiales bacterium]|nr:phenylalanyl-tRNA synthetase beta chain [Burkholderiales bacterium]
MRISETWLKTFVDPGLDTDALAERLTMAGLEVETVEPAAPPFSGVVVARILSVAPHPNADRLRVCTVDAGGAPLPIVCGAPNAAEGMTVPCALEGATLPGGLTIRRTTVRGVESHGMLCSAKELGLADDASGLLALDDSLAPGSNLREALALDDAILTLKLTPNRADCLSMLGVARDVAALTGARLSVPDTSPAPVASQARRDVRIDEPEACPRFGGRVIEHIDASRPTPAWMRTRLERAGIRSISAVVDVTNYVMLELGQPMHAYDARHLDGALVVRFARAGETLTLLNGDVLDLESDLLLVCDQRKPLGLAGIMGGEHSGIAADTSTVYLEAACWNPAVVQGRMRRLGFTSDAGFRFERGVDPMIGPAAIERATALILGICGGRAGPRTDAQAALPPRASVRVRTSRVARLLGVPIVAADVADVFARLDLAARRDGDDFDVTPPTWRFDLAIEEDFVEEVARVRGYASIPAAPAAHVQHMLARPESRRSPFALRRALAARDWQEVITFSFVSSEAERAIDPEAAPVAVLNPIAAHLDVMRTSLLPGLIGTLKSNASRREPRVRVFEVGCAFRRGADGIAQPIRVGGLAWGTALPEQWGSAPRGVDLFDVKADLEAIAHPLGVTTAAAAHPALHPGRSAAVSIGGAAAGWLGELHPRLVRAFELTGAPVVFEVGLAALLARPIPAGRAASRLPVVRRDLALVMDDAVPVQAVLDALARSGPPFVVALRPFDVFRGGSLPPGRKSVAILVLMQDTARTLTDAEIDAAVGSLAAAAHREFGATLRSQDSR